MSEVYIYVLKCPATDTVMYVGRTVQPNIRYEQHLSDSCDMDHRKKSKWMHSLLSAGQKPIMQIIETCTQDDCHKRESFWIHHYRNRNPELTNAKSLPTKLTPITIRIPEDEYRFVLESSEKENRSLNAQIVTLLQEAIAARRTRQPGSTSLPGPNVDG